MIAEVLYSKEFKNVTYNTGIICSGNYSGQNNKTLDTILNAKSTLQNFYYYDEVVGKIKKVGYNLGLGYKISMFQSKELNVTYNTHTFKPRMTLTYNISQYLNLKISSSLSPQIPSLSALSNNKYFRDSLIAESGNPNLKPYNLFDNYIDFSYAKSKYQFDLSVYYDYFDKPFLPIIEHVNNIYIETSENYSWEKDIQPQLYFKLNPFKTQWLQFSASYTFLYFQNKYENINSLTSQSMSYDLSANHKNWTMEFIYYNNGKSLNGDFISKNESALIVNIQYKYKNATFSIGAYQPFIKSIEYKSETVPSCILKESSISNFYDNGNMLYFSFVYNISFGKKASDADIKLNNKDNDSGVFKAK